jgi:hypothetical protein
MIDADDVEDMAALGLTTPAQFAALSRLITRAQKVAHDLALEGRRSSDRARKRLSRDRSRDQRETPNTNNGLAESASRDLSRDIPPQKRSFPPTPPLQEKTPPLLVATTSLTPEPELALGLPGPTGASPSRKKNDHEIVEWFENQWNALASACGLETIRAMSDRRIRLVRCRAIDLVDALGFADPRAGFTDTFNRIRGSPFLRGSDGAWRCDVDWLLAESNFLKVHEGKYAQRPKQFQPAARSRR